MKQKILNQYALFYKILHYIHCLIFPVYSATVTQHRILHTIRYNDGFVLLHKQHLLFYFHNGT